MTGNLILDPCFGSVDVAIEVLCPEGPRWGSATLLTLSSDVPIDERVDWDSRDFDDPGGPDAVWAVELANGARCIKLAGGTRDMPGGIVELFSCALADKRGLILGRLDDRDVVWRARLLWDEAISTEQVPIRVVWF